MFNIFKKIFHILNSISVSAPGYILFLSMGDFVIWKIEIKKKKMCSIHYWLLKTIDCARGYSNVAAYYSFFKKKCSYGNHLRFHSPGLVQWLQWNVDRLKLVLQARTFHRSCGCFPCVIKYETNAGANMVIRSRQSKNDRYLMANRKRTNRQIMVHCTNKPTL